MVLYSRVGSIFPLLVSGTITHSNAVEGREIRTNRNHPIENTTRGPTWT